MVLNKKQAQLDALWGKDGYLSYQFDEGGRQSNRDYRRKEVSNRLKGIMGLMARQAGPPDIRTHPQATNSPTDMPALGGHQDRSLGGFQAGTIGSYQGGSLANIFETALTAPDSGPKTPDLRKYGPAAASTFPLTAGSLLAAKIRGLNTEETPEGAYRIERDKPSQSNYGQALGEAIWMNPDLTEQQDKGVYEHELGHVSDARGLGLAFPIANTVDQLRALMTGTDPQDAHFEQTAAKKGRALIGGGSE